MTEGLEARLAAYQRFGIKLGLDNIRALCAAMGHPETAVPAVHIAGTNGKGSTVAALAAIFRGANYRCGAYTSPHLVDVTERIVVEGVPVTEAYLERVLDAVDAAAEQLSDDEPVRATYFEVLTAAAYYIFARRQIDVAIYEVGLGGRLDSTNIIEPEVTCITTIGLDHTKHLGPTIRDIAAEKAGIIKTGVPLICGRIGDEAAAVIRVAAAAHHAPLQRIDVDFGIRPGASLTATGLQHAVWWGEGHDDVEFEIPLHGRWQLDNAACALAIAQSLVDQGWNISPTAMVVGLREMEWHGRLEWLSREPPVLFDAAHNPHAFRTILPGVRTEAADGVLPVLAVLDDKDAETMCEELSRLSPRVVVTSSNQPRSLHVERLAEVAGRHFADVHCAVTITEALMLARALAPEQTTFVVGSALNYAEALSAVAR